MDWVTIYCSELSKTYIIYFDCVVQKKKKCTYHLHLVRDPCERIIQNN